MIKRLEKNARLAEVVISNGHIYLAGQLADDISLDIASQTLQTFNNIDKYLKKAGSSKSDILSATIYLKDINKDYKIFNEQWDKWIDSNHPPARTCVEAKMYDPNVLVELTVIARLPE
ncbi:RidA family protein [Acinetobacter sp. HY1485]|uniref:RidA family protein n=1 Tax=Acinetobacter sp. HY1485 TaxID=2970918 RepID=UPI0022B942C3|nr:RidA family protein [Acinetobacter sp. HY1485]